MMNKTLCFTISILLIVILICTSGIISFANPSLKLDGSGTKDDPYIINNADDLYNAIIFLTDNDDGKKVYCKLTDNIDMSAVPLLVSPSKNPEKNIIGNIEFIDSDDYLIKIEKPGNGFGKTEKIDVYPKDLGQMQIIKTDSLAGTMVAFPGIAFTANAIAVLIVAAVVVAIVKKRKTKVNE